MPTFDALRRDHAAFSAATANSSSTPKAPTASFTTTKSNTPSASSRCSSTWSSSPTAACRCSAISWDTKTKAVVRRHAARRHRRAARAGRPAALDRHRSELEHDVRRLPLDEPPEELRPRERTPITRRSRRSTSVAKTCHGPGSVHVELASSRSLFWDRRIGYGLAEAQEGTSNAVQLETCANAIRGGRRSTPNFRAGEHFLDLLRARALASWALPCRRADSGRSLRIRLVPAEQDVRQGHSLHRLPRSAFAEAQVRRQPALHPVPSAGQVRHAGPSPSHRRLAAHAMRAAATCRRGRTW